MSFHDLRQAVKSEIFDYQMLMHHLREYKKPRDKTTFLLGNHSIIRVKKGLYIFGSNYERAPVSQEVLASMLYSPSYVSLHYALSKYSLIPERAYGVTSVCLKRSKIFKTPLGLFTYTKKSLATYPIGLEKVEIPRQGSYLIARPEKALVDLLSDCRWRRS